MNQRKLTNIITEKADKLENPTNSCGFRNFQLWDVARDVEKTAEDFAS